MCIHSRYIIGFVTIVTIAWVPKGPRIICTEWIQSTETKTTRACTVYEVCLLTYQNIVVWLIKASIQFRNKQVFSLTDHTSSVSKTTAESVTIMKMPRYQLKKKKCLMVIWIYETTQNIAKYIFFVLQLCWILYHQVTFNNIWRFSWQRKKTSRRLKIAETEETFLLGGQGLS